MGDLHETICALSTAPGRSGIAVVRLSGPETFTLLPKIFISRFGGSDKLPARQSVLGRVLDARDGSCLDQALVTCFPAPHSYTGEDLCEFSLHGSPVLVTALLDGLCTLGARIAEPGEFTLRAFVNGRIDLSQAEAVGDLISAKTLYQAKVANRQRSGSLAKELTPAKQLLVDIIVQLESAVEFVEEDLSLNSREEISGKLDRVRDDLRRWVESFRRGRLIHDGFSLVIIGRPNVGKSLLFNALLAQDRSIVTDIPGTTRDLVSETASLRGIPVRLLDTAGVRDSDDRVEQLGVDRSLQAMADADALLLVLDGSRPPDAADSHLRAHVSELSGIVVVNKCDLTLAWTEDQKKSYSGNWPCISVSALTGARIEDLKHAILERLFGDEGPECDGLLITNLRHCQCLESANEFLTRASDALRQGLSEEFALIDLHRGLHKLGEITGETTVEDLLGQIFSRFCIGK